MILGILALVAASWWTRGVDDAGRLFQMLHGVLLATMTFVWGSQAVDRANAEADEAREEKFVAVQSGSQIRKGGEVLARELQQMRWVLKKLRDDPSEREKVDALLREAGREEP